ncbi:MAG: hypothetical protein GX977_01410 [Firmicutes bacterium]|nr:hypothetical protein [Bacillota bacterium]
MKKIMAMITLVALMVGVTSLACAAEGGPTISEKVDLQVNVSQWANLVGVPESMAINLENPGGKDEERQTITVQSNTDVSVSIEGLVFGDEAWGAAVEAGAVTWGLGFAPTSADLLNLYTSFEVGAGSVVDKDLVFRANWIEDNDWWKLIAGNYSGSANITVSAIQ